MEIISSNNLLIYKWLKNQAFVPSKYFFQKQNSKMRYIDIYYLVEVFLSYNSLLLYLGKNKSISHSKKR